MSCKVFPPLVLQRLRKPFFDFGLHVTIQLSVCNRMLDMRIGKYGIAILALAARKEQAFHQIVIFDGIGNVDAILNRIMSVMLVKKKCPFFERSFFVSVFPNEHAQGNKVAFLEADDAGNHRINRGRNDRNRVIELIDVFIQCFIGFLKISDWYMKKLLVS